MKFWGALAVQLLAIVLRDQTRGVSPQLNLPDCPPVVCQCDCEVEKRPEAETGWGKDIWKVTSVGGLGALIGAFLASFGQKRLENRQDGKAECGAGRRRGGGVLREADHRE